MRWRGRLAVATLRALARLPDAATHALAGLLMRLSVLFRTVLYQVTRANIEHCFPEMPVASQQALIRGSIKDDLVGGIDIARTWCQPERTMARVSRVSGELEALNRCVSEGKPVVILAPHLGNWEIANFWLGQQYDFHALYKPSPMPALDQLIRESRQHFGSTLYPATGRGVAGLVRSLKKGGVTAILPDQVAAKGGGRLATFFGLPAWTPTLPCRLIQQSHARAFLIFVRRLADGGYEIVLRDPDPEIYAEDIDTALTALNRSVESLVREEPLQYNWSYKRFRMKGAQIYPASARQGRAQKKARARGKRNDNSRE